MITAEIVHDDSSGATEVREIDLNKFGDCYEPTAYTRTASVAECNPVEEAQEAEGSESD